MCTTSQLNLGDGPFSKDDLSHAVLNVRWLREVAGLRAARAFKRGGSAAACKDDAGAEARHSRPLCAAFIATQCGDWTQRRLGLFHLLEEA
jgi:hypothetical protein